MSACDEDVGSPNHQVSKSQAMAPISPANTTASVSDCGFTTSVAMVAATLVPKMRNATKLKNAAQNTAIFGVSTRVDTTVAMELAASWKPLKKSNARAMAMTTTRPAVTTDQACIKTMDSSVLATSSQPSIAPSSWSTMSFHFRTSMAL